MARVAGALVLSTTSSGWSCSTTGNVSLQTLAVDNCTYIGWRGPIPRYPSCPLEPGACVWLGHSRQPRGCSGQEHGTRGPDEVRETTGNRDLTLGPKLSSSSLPSPSPTTYVPDGGVGRCEAELRSEVVRDGPAVGAGAGDAPGWGYGEVGGRMAVPSSTHRARACGCVWLVWEEEEARGRALMRGVGVGEARSSMSERAEDERLLRCSAREWLLRLGMVSVCWEGGGG